jgi:NADP-dependent 3-hydroxy acid dehydrogenase YdfG
VHRGQGWGHLRGNLEIIEADYRAIAVLYEEVLTQCPALDTLFNNAGIMRNLNLNRDRNLKDVTRMFRMTTAGASDGTCTTAPDNASPPWNSASRVWRG